MTLDEFLFYVDDESIEVRRWVDHDGRLTDELLYKGHDYHFLDSMEYRDLRDERVESVGARDGLLIYLRTRPEKESCFNPAWVSPVFTW